MLQAIIDLITAPVAVPVWMILIVLAADAFAIYASIRLVVSRGRVARDRAEMRVALGRAVAAQRRAEMSSEAFRAELYVRTGRWPAAPNLTYLDEGGFARTDLEPLPVVAVAGEAIRLVSGGEDEWAFDLRAIADQVMEDDFEADPDILSDIAQDLRRVADEIDPPEEDDEDDRDDEDDEDDASAVDELPPEAFAVAEGTTA